LAHLDLSKNKLAAWDEALAPISLLPMLSSLDLSDNPLPMPPSAPSPLPSLRVLALNHCGLTWPDVLALARFVPQLQELSLARNAIREVTEEPSTALRELRVLDLDDNAIATWADLARLASFAPSLTRLLVSGNKLSSVAGDCPVKKRQFGAVVELAIAGNALASWDAIAALSAAFPALRSLRVVGNPVLAGIPPLLARTKVLALLPALDSLNGSVVRPAEREEAARVLQQQQVSQMATPVAATTAALPSGFVLVTIQCNAVSGTKQGTVQQRLPGSMTIRDLRQLCQRLFGVVAADQALFFRERQTDTVGAFPQPMDDDSHELRMYCGTLGGVVVIEDRKH